MVIFLLGFGLVEIPRNLFKLTDYEGRIKYLEWLAGENKEIISTKIDEKEELRKSIPEDKMKYPLLRKLSSSIDIDISYFTSDNSNSSSNGDKEKNISDTIISNIIYTENDLKTISRLEKFNFQVIRAIK